MDLSMLIQLSQQDYYDLQYSTFYTVTALYLHRCSSTAPWKYLSCYYVVPTQLRGYSKVTVELL